MRDELKIARLREELHQAMQARAKAAKTLQSHQDAVAILETRGMANSNDRQGLQAAQRFYDKCTAEVEKLEAELDKFNI